MPSSITAIFWQLCYRIFKSICFALFNMWSRIPLLVQQHLPFPAHCYYTPTWAYGMPDIYRIA